LRLPDSEVDEDGLHLLQRGDLVLHRRHLPSRSSSLVDCS
jgi:hypothetical protein